MIPFFSEKISYVKIGLPSDRAISMRTDIFSSKRRKPAIRARH
ncbi:hypothetical protein EVA_08894 [gut metagenome]|uniref:Uncharacterized protein n=1 Tax=gut metagenome TaxID=749906 RepID=J9G801_9ZZZZ